MLDLSFESVQFVHRFRLVVAPGEVHAFRVVQVPPQKSHENFQAPAAPVHKIAVEQVWILCRRLTVQSENIAQVIILTMGIPTYSYLSENIFFLFWLKPCSLKIEL